MSETEQNDQDRANIESPEEKLIFEELQQIYHKNFIKHYDEIVKFSQNLRDKYAAACNTCRLFHILSGSSVLPEIEIESFDFPEHEIENFLRNIEQSHTK